MNENEEQTCDNCRHCGEDRRSRFCVMEEYAMVGFDGVHCIWWQPKIDEDVVIEE